MPDSLPARLYLLAYDINAQRLTSRSEIGYALRAAALTDLLMRGNIVDEGGRARTVPGSAPPGDSVLEHVLWQLERSRPHAWRHWVRKSAESTPRAVRDQLAEDRWVRLERRRILGLFPSTRVVVRDTRVLRQLRSQAGAALRGSARADVDPRDAAVVALAAAGGLRKIVSKNQKLENRSRIAKLSELAGPAVPALRKVRRDARTAAATSA